MAQDAAAVISPADPVCSICIANFNGESVIGPCLDSIRNQDCDLPLEIIVHDDASTDSSVEFIRTRYPDVTLIPSEGNVGYCVSNNRMVSRARGRYILLLNNDAVLRRDAVRTLFLHAQQHPEPAILGLPQYDIETGALIDRGSLLDPFMNPVPNLDPGRVEVAMVMGACLWIPKLLWVELGGFPEWFGSLAEDLYLCCLARLRGFPVMVPHESGYDHWVGRSFRGGKVVRNTLQTSYQRRALSERNKSYAFFICWPTALVYPFIALHLFLLTFEGLLLSAIKADGKMLESIYLPCVASVWKERHRLLQERERVQRSARIGIFRFLRAFTPMPYKMKMLMRFGLPAIRS
ncbi:MAG: putative glycosyltransferase EpsH [Syntrophus sp. PtaU1.Bin208]|nr:MAG: putative glycosyltransferase EpsH [Syntrophus sp. PtaU1.Bin208]